MEMNLKNTVVAHIEVEPKSFFSCRGMSNILELGEDLGISPTIFTNRILSLNGPIRLSCNLRNLDLFKVEFEMKIFVILKGLEQIIQQCFVVFANSLSKLAFPLRSGNVTYAVVARRVLRLYICVCVLRTF